MPWITRDSAPSGTYRIFGEKPIRAKFVSYDGDVLKDYTWTLLRRPYIHVDFVNNKIKLSSYGEADYTYGPLSNDENTILNEDDSPLYLEPGEGPVEVKLVLKEVPQARLFEGENI